MSETQTLYTFFFALYYTYITTATVKLHPYDTPSMWKRNYHAWLRFVVSNVVLNMFPLIFFFYTINVIAETDFQVFCTRCGHTGVFIKNFWNLVTIVFLSMIGQGFYRIYYGLMLLKNEQGQYCFYDIEVYNHENTKPPENITKHVKTNQFGKFANFFMVSNTRSATYVYQKENTKPSGLPNGLAADLETRPDSHSEPIVHLGPGLIWVLLTCLLLHVISGFINLWYLLGVLILFFLYFLFICCSYVISNNSVPR